MADLLFRSCIDSTLKKRHSQHTLESHTLESHTSIQLTHRGVAYQNTVIIFDWDDTLLCTSYLRSLDIGLFSSIDDCMRIDSEMNLISELVVSILSTALNHG